MAAAKCYIAKVNSRKVLILLDNMLTWWRAYEPKVTQLCLHSVHNTVGAI